MFLFHKNSGRGSYPPDPQHDIRAREWDRSNIVRPREPDGADHRQATAARSRPRPEVPERSMASRSVSRRSAVTERRSTPSRRDRWYGSDPAGRAAWACTCRTAPMPHRAYRRAGSLPSTARRGGSAPAIRGSLPNPKPSGDLRNPRSARPSAILLHKHPDVEFTPLDRQRALPPALQFGLRQDGSNAMSNGRRSLPQSTPPHRLHASRTRGSEQPLHLAEAATRLPTGLHQRSSITPPVHEPTHAPTDFLVRIDDEEGPVAYPAPIVSHCPFGELCLEPPDLFEMAT